MRNYKEETIQRVEWIRDVIKSARADGVIFGNSGGKDCALVGILCKQAHPNTIGVMMPCSAAPNYGRDMTDALFIAEKYGIQSTVVDLTDTRNSLLASFTDNAALSQPAVTNIAPRLRMTTLYALGASKNLLVAGTSNRSERHMGYFTKWGDGGCDFNPIADLTVSEVYEFLRYLDAPSELFDKPPSAGLFDGQTDEAEMGVTYAAIDAYLRGEEINAADREIIERYHNSAQHKLNLPYMYNKKQS